MRKNASIFIATHAWFDEEKFPRAKSENGSSKNKLEICPPDINQDQEDIDNSKYPNSDTDSDHNHDDPNNSSSDDTPSDTQEELQSESEHFESADSEDECYESSSHHSFFYLIRSRMDFYYVSVPRDASWVTHGS